MEVLEVARRESHSQEMSLIEVKHFSILLCRLFRHVCFFVIIFFVILNSVPVQSLPMPVHRQVLPWLCAMQGGLRDSPLFAYCTALAARRGNDLLMINSFIYFRDVTTCCSSMQS